MPAETKTAPAPAKPAAPARAKTTTPAAAKVAATPPTEPSKGSKSEFTNPLGAQPPKRLSATKAFGEDMHGEFKKTVDESSRAYRKKVKVHEELDAPSPAPSAEAPATSPEPQSAETPAQAPETKFKFQGKEYTHDELQSVLAGIEAQKQQAEPEPAPYSEPQVPTDTPEQLAAKERAFLQSLTGRVKADMTEEELDTVLAGGKEAVAALQNIRKRDIANAILETQKGLKPVFDNLFAQMQPIVAQHENLQRYTVEQHFVNKHKDFAPVVDRARGVAEQLFKLYPEQVMKMTQDQFADEVARQTDNILTAEYKHWYPSKPGTWRDLYKQQQAAPAVPAAPAVNPAQVTAPAAAPRQAVRAPASNAPQGVVGMPGPTWAKGVAASLRN